MVILVPNLSRKLVKAFTWNIAVSRFLPVKPDYQFMTLLFRQRKNAFLEFSQAHTKENDTKTRRFQAFARTSHHRDHACLTKRTDPAGPAFANSSLNPPTDSARIIKRSRPPLALPLFESGSR